MKKKILFLIPSLRGGGAEKVILNIVNSLSVNKYDIVLVVVNKVGVLCDFEREGVRIIDLKKRKIKEAFFLIFKLINKEEPDIIFSTLNHLNLMMSLLKIFFKRIKFIGRQTKKGAYTAGRGVIKEFLSIKLSYLLNNLDYVIAQSIGMKQELIQACNVNPRLIRVINNPATLDEIYRLKLESFNFIESDKIRLIGIGRLVKDKGFDRMIRTFAMLPKDKYELIILGEGEDKQRLVDLTHELNIVGNVIFEGFVKNPYKYLYNSNFFLITSFSEGFSNAVVDALACGVYVIGFDFFGDEIITENVNGNIIRNNSINDLKQMIIEKSNEVLDKDVISKTVNKLENKLIINQYESLFDEC